MINKKAKFIFLIVILFILSSCSEKSFFDRIATNNVIPDAITEPVVNHFLSENNINIEWENDLGADEYILYRSVLPDSGYSEIYSGNESSYEDSSVVNEKFYYYKLAKKRGQKEFNKSGFTSGVANAKRRDLCEPNNQRGSAYDFNISVLGESLSFNMYFFRDNAGNLIEDFDWFYAVVPPRKTMVIRIQRADSIIAASDIKISIDNGVTEVITFTSGYNLNNYSYSEAIIYFCISINKSTFLGDPSGAGGAIKEYRIDFQTLIPVT